MEKNILVFTSQKILNTMTTLEVEQHFHGHFVIQLFDEGFTRKEICKITGVEYQTVKLCIRKRDEIVAMINSQET